jgi:hypothetical protein
VIVLAGAAVAAAVGVFGNRGAGYQLGDECSRSSATPSTARPGQLFLLGLIVEGARRSADPSGLGGYQPRLDTALATTPLSQTASSLGAWAPSALV